VGPQGTLLVGVLLVGKCVCVYWPGDWCCYHGRVTSWNGAEHTILYEDSQVVAEELGGLCAPYWMMW
jgi:hypothetical protein